MSTMFEHSVKVPRHYKVASKILKKISTEGGSVKSLLYDEKLRHYRTNVLFALITETVKHAAVINNIFEYCEILRKEPRLDPWLARILTAELLYGKQALPGNSKPEQTIFSYKEQFEKYISEHQDEMKPEVACKPRYVRVNTNLLTTSDAISAFQDEQYKFVRCTSGPYKDFLDQVQKLRENEFTQDYHVKTIFVFPSGIKLYEHELYLESKIILQNKATAMAVHLLAPPPGSVIMDMCAAPGIKTTQLAAYMRNNCKIYAVERNERRYKTLCDFVSKTKSSSVETIHKDCLDIKRGDYDDVQYIILDPSCSGSGMEFSVHNYIDDNRLSKLTSLQEKFLKHAMNAFPNAQRIVYSTCSLFPEENERVVTNVVRTSRSKWRVRDTNALLKGQWNNFGSAMYGSIGPRCLYARPESDFTTGFFLAVIDRKKSQREKNPKRLAQAITEETSENKESKEKAPTINDNSSMEVVNDNNFVKIGVMENEGNDGVQISKPKKKKHKRKHDAMDSNVNENKSLENMEELEPKKKKRKPNEVNTLVDTLAELDINTTKSDAEHAKKLKKKKKKKDKHEKSASYFDLTLIKVKAEREEKTKNKKKRKHDSEMPAIKNISICDELELPKKHKRQKRGNLDSYIEKLLKKMKKKSKDNRKRQ